MVSSIHTNKNTNLHTYVRMYMFITHMYTVYMLCIHTYVYTSYVCIYIYIHTQAEGNKDR